MAPPVEKKKKHSSDLRLNSSTGIGEDEQQPMGSLMTSFGKRRSVRIVKKMNNRILRKIWICTDVLMDIFPFFCRPQLGLKLALLSPRFDSLVATHFNGKSELKIWRDIAIRKMRTKAKLFVEKKNSKTMQFPLPNRPLPNKICFENLRIEYIDHSVITFLRSNQQIFDKGTDLGLSFYSQSIWSVFIRQIWPIFAQNIRRLRFPSGIPHLNKLLRHISPSILTDLNQLNAIDSNGLLADGTCDFDGPNAATSAGQALFEWLHTPKKDGQPKQLRCKGTNFAWVNNFKEKFLRATTSVSYKIRIELFESTEIGPFELINEPTNEKLTLEKEEKSHNHIVLLLKRCQIGGTIQWKDEKTDNLNKIAFALIGDCIGRFSPPKTDQMKAKDRLKMNPGPSGQRKKK